MQEITAELVDDLVTPIEVKLEKSISVVLLHSPQLYMVAHDLNKNPEQRPTIPHM